MTVMSAKTKVINDIVKTLSIQFWPQTKSWSDYSDSKGKSADYCNAQRLYDSVIVPRWISAFLQKTKLRLMLSTELGIR